MSFENKKGITVASGFKLQAEALLDARGQVDTIQERDELVTLHAVTEGLNVFVKETKTTYVWNGTGWDELSKGSGYVHPDGPGHKHIPAGGTKGQVLKNKADGAAEWGSLTAADVGAASLDESGKVPAAQLPSYVDDVLEGTYVSNTVFNNEKGTPYKAESGKIYVDTTSGKTYRWSGTQYVEISASLALGETPGTAFPGDKGKVAYDHSQSAHAPANAQKNVQADWNESDSESDAFIKNKPTALPANGGNADTVGGHTVEANVPANADFSKYEHPENHPATMITEDATHRFATDEEKKAWNAKADIYFGAELPKEAPAGAFCFLTK